MRQKFYQLPLVILTLVALSACQHANQSAPSQERLIPEDVINKALVSYSPAEQLKIKADQQVIHDKIFAEATPIRSEKLYIGTAGGPGASKSTILETFLQDYPGLLYIDPDMRSLKFMIYTYAQDLNVLNISKAKSYDALLEASYAKWRDGSNYIANSLLNEAFATELPIAHGTTGTSLIIGDFYKKLKRKGYKIILLLCGSSDDNRAQSLQHRAQDQRFVQVTQKDFVEKGQMFFDRLSTYVLSADELHLYWTESFKTGSKKIATYTPLNGLKIIDTIGFDHFEKAYHLYEKQKKRNPAKGLKALFERPLSPQKN